MTWDPTPLQERLGWQFRNTALLREALTHSTYANENPEAGPHNERLEFVGDAVLGALAAELLYQQHQDAREGELSRRRAAMVCREGLEVMARSLNVQQWLLLGEGQRKASVAETSSRLVADAFEALAGAVFFDGGYEAARDCFAPLLRRAMQEGIGAVDAKTQLQEFCQAQGLRPPRYVVLSVDGPPHARRYTCAVYVQDEVKGQGEASNKRAAEQQCAAQALEALQES